MMNHPPHQLLGRSEEEITWFKRRSLVQAAGLWVASGGWTAAHAQAQHHGFKHGFLRANRRALRNRLPVRLHRRDVAPQITGVGAPDARRAPCRFVRIRRQHAVRSRAQAQTSSVWPSACR